MLLFLAGLVSACGPSSTSSATPTPTSPQGIRGIFHEYSLPPSPFVPGTITAGPDGNLWFTEILIDQNGSPQAGKIERITPTGALKEFPLPSATPLATSITAGPDGNLWFSEGDKIGRITTAGNITEFPLPSVNTYLSSITAGPDGNLWFTGIGSNNGPSIIGVITPQGKMREFTLPHSILGSITRGPDGNLWFAEYQYSGTGTTAGEIGRITTAGKISGFPLPTSSNSPISITFGADHTLWFIEVGITPANPNGKNDKIGHLV
jgi:streptogramin lyase